MKLIISFVILACFVAGQAPAPVAQQPIPRPSVRGTVITPGGGICNTTFLVDSGASNCYIPQDCAVAAGLGTVGPPNSTFTPTPGLNPTCTPGNNGVFWKYCFPGLTLMALDSKGHVCFKTINVCVVKDLSNGQAITLNIGLISYPWLSCVGGTIGPYGTTCWGSATQVVNPQQSQAATVQGFLAPTEPYEVFAASMTGRPLSQGATAPTQQISVRLLSSLRHHFIPASLAAALNLEIGPSEDLSLVDPESLEDLDRNGLRTTNQTIFARTRIPSFSWGMGGARSDKAYIIDDQNTTHMIVGGLGTALIEDMILAFDEHYSPTTVLSHGVPAPTPPLPYDVIGVTPASTSVGGQGDFNLIPMTPTGGFIEGATLISFDASEELSRGTMFGLYPDSVTWACILAPVSPGSVFRFTDTPGVFPHEPLHLPAGTFAPLVGLTFDIGMVYATSNGISTTGPARLTF